MGWLYNRYAVLGVFIIGMSLIPFNDALMKQLSTSIPVFEFLVLRGGFMLLGVLCIPVTFVALREVGWVGLIQVFLRGTLLVLALTLLFLSISMVKLATAYDVFYRAHDDFPGRSAVVGGTTIAGALACRLLGTGWCHRAYEALDRRIVPLDGFGNISGHGLRGVSVGHPYAPAKREDRCRRHRASIGLSVLGFPNLLGNVAIRMAKRLFRRA